MNLSDTKINHEYIIQEINTDKCTKARLYSLGVLKGTKVKILNRRNNGATILKVRGTRLGIDKEITEAIEIAEKEKLNGSPAKTEKESYHFQRRRFK